MPAILVLDDVVVFKRSGVKITMIMSSGHVENLTTNSEARAQEIEEELWVVLEKKGKTLTRIG